MQVVRATLCFFAHRRAVSLSADFFYLAERDERDDGVITVGRGVRGRVVEAETVFFGCRSGNFAFRHFSSKAKKSTNKKV